MISNELKNYFEKIKKISIISNNIVINDKYLLIKNNNNDWLYDYLLSISYEYYLPVIDKVGNYYIFPFYNNVEKSNENIVKGIKDALFQLHLNSLKIINYEKEKIDVLYKEINEKIDVVLKFYLNLQDMIDEYYFPPEPLYILVQHISKFYKLLNLSKSKLEEWKNNPDNFIVHECVITNNNSISNFVISEEKKYFLDLGLSERGLLVYDLVNFYNNNYLYSDLIKEYFEMINISDYEYNLFLSLIAIPKKIMFSSDNKKDSALVKKIINYVDITLDFILEENQKNKKTD